MPIDSNRSINPEEILKAYMLGYFPMARTHEDEHAVWVLPEYRGVLPLECARLPRKLRKFVARDAFEITANTDFEAVIGECAARGMGPAQKVREERDETWINEQIRQVYIELHHLGYAHSLECWHEDQLVGGLYGLSMGSVFFGESMFSRVTNASKVTFAHLIGRLKLAGYTLIDTQFYTEHLGQFGVIEISNEEYQGLLERALRSKIEFPIGSNRGGFSDKSKPAQLKANEKQAPNCDVAGELYSTMSTSVSTTCVLQSIIQTS